MRAAAKIFVILLWCFSSFPVAMAVQGPENDPEWDALSSLDEGTPLILETSSNEEIPHLEFVRRDQDSILLRDSTRQIR